MSATHTRCTAMHVVFDDRCNVCNGYVRFLIRRDRQARFDFIPAASKRGRDLLEACGELPDDPATMIVVDGDHRLLRSDAVIAAVAALGGGWRAARVMQLVPRRLRDALYGAFAKRRYRWFGRVSACAACDATDGAHIRR